MIIQKIKKLELLLKVNDNSEELKKLVDEINKKELLLNELSEQEEEYLGSFLVQNSINLNNKYNDKEKSNRLNISIITEKNLLELNINLLEETLKSIEETVLKITREMVLKSNSLAVESAAWIDEYIKSCVTIEETEKIKEIINSNKDNSRIELINFLKKSINNNVKKLGSEEVFKGEELSFNSTKGSGVADVILLNRKGGISFSYANKVVDGVMESDQNYRHLATLVETLKNNSNLKLFKKEYNRVRGKNKGIDSERDLFRKINNNIEDYKSTIEKMKITSFQFISVNYKKNIESKIDEIKKKFDIDTDFIDKVKENIDVIYYLMGKAQNLNNEDGKAITDKEVKIDLKILEKRYGVVDKDEGYLEELTINLLKELRANKDNKPITKIEKEHIEESQTSAKNEVSQNVREGKKGLPSNELVIRDILKNIIKVESKKDIIVLERKAGISIDKDNTIYTKEILSKNNLFDFFILLNNSKTKENMIFDGIISLFKDNDELKMDNLIEYYKENPEKNFTSLFKSNVDREEEKKGREEAELKAEKSKLETEELKLKSLFKDLMTEEGISFFITKHSPLEHSLNIEKVTWNKIEEYLTEMSMEEFKSYLSTECKIFYERIEKKSNLEEESKIKEEKEIKKELDKLYDIFKDETLVLKAIFENYKDLESLKFKTSNLVSGKSKQTYLEYNLKRITKEEYNLEKDFPFYFDKIKDGPEEKKKKKKGRRM